MRCKIMQVETKIIILHIKQTLCRSRAINRDARARNQRTFISKVNAQFSSNFPLLAIDDQQLALTSNV